MGGVRIGKAVVFDRNARQAQARGVRALRGGGADSDDDASNRLVRVLLAPLADAAGGLHPSHRQGLEELLAIGPPAAAARRFVAYNAVLALLKEVGRRRPLLL